ncbi:MAG: hypothetical protein IJV17_03585 [Prevotella sp.]|nr:hypothetical protein [Prevotella sp.]
MIEKMVAKTKTLLCYAVVIAMALPFLVSCSKDDDIPVNTVNGKHLAKVNNMEYVYNTHGQLVKIKKQWF